MLSTVLFGLVIAIGVVFGMSALMIIKDLVVGITRAVWSIVAAVLTAAGALLEITREVLLRAGQLLAGTVRSIAGVIRNTFSGRCRRPVQQAVHASPHVHQQVDRLKGIGNRVARRSWSTKEVVILLLVVLITLPIFPAVLVVGVLAFAIVGAVATVNSILNWSDRESGVDANQPAVAKVETLATEQQAPANEKPVEVVRPVVYPSAYEAPTVYPESKPGFLVWMGQTAAMLMLFACGAGVILFANRVEFAEESRAILMPAVAAQEAPNTNRALTVDNNLRPGEAPPDTLTSRLYLDKEDAEIELLERIAGYLSGMMTNQFGVEASDWSPSRNWIRKSFVRSFDVKTANQDGIEKYYVEMDVDLTSKRMEQVKERFLSDGSWYRTRNLAKGYAGAVLILGGLSIFLRLGTSRRPTSPNVD